MEHTCSVEHAVWQRATCKILSTVLLQARYCHHSQTQTDKHTPPSPPLVLRGPSDKSPVNADRLAHQVLTVEPFHGCLGLFVCLILHQCIPLGTVTRTSCELLHIYSITVLEFSILQFNNTAQKTGLLITQLFNNILQVLVSAGPL